MPVKGTAHCRTCLSLLCSSVAIAEVDRGFDHRVHISQRRQQSTDTTSLLAAPVSRYLLADDLVLPRSTRVSLGIDRRYKQMQASATYAYIRGGAVTRGENMNAPVDGVRPDARHSNVIDVVSDGSGRQHQLQTNLTINQGALFPLNKSAPRFNFKRVIVFLNYTLARNRNNSDGAFSVPAFGDIDLDWGPANNDVRHRLNATLNTTRS